MQWGTMQREATGIQAAELKLLAGDRDGAIALLGELLEHELTSDQVDAVEQIALLADDVNTVQAARARRAPDADDGPHTTPPDPDRTLEQRLDDRPILELREPRVRADEDAEHLDPDLGPDEQLARLLDPAMADVVRFIHLFAGREDHWARQWVDGERTGYSPVTGPITPDLVRAHLAGSVTIGVYPLRSDQTVTFFVFDLDIRRAARDAAQGNLAAIATLRALVRESTQTLRDGLTELGLPVLVEQSGYKGWHIWGFLASSLPADLVHRFGRLASSALRPASADITIEFFPRQPRVGSDGLGNLIKLPLGIHRRTGRRALFVDPAFAGFEDPFTPLRTVERITRDQLLDAIDALQARNPPPIPPSPDGDDHAPTATTPHASRTSRAAPPRLNPAELRDHPTLGPVLEGCAVLRQIVARAVDARRMTHDERVVLAQSLGGLDDGVGAVNGVFALCPEIAPHELLQRPLRGHPISCAGVRRRVPHITRCVDCHCLFEPDNLAYPSPVLHAPAAVQQPGRPMVPAVAAAQVEAWPEASGSTFSTPPAPPSTPVLEPDVEVAQRAAGAEQFAPTPLDAPRRVEPSAESAVALPAVPSVPTTPDRAPVVHLPAPDVRGPDAALVDGLAEALLRLPEQRISVAGGTFKLRLVGGRHVVVFTPKGG